MSRWRSRIWGFEAWGLRLESWNFTFEAWRVQHPATPASSFRCCSIIISSYDSSCTPLGNTALPFDDRTRTILMPQAVEPWKVVESPPKSHSARNCASCTPSIMGRGSLCTEPLERLLRTVLQEHYHDSLPDPNQPLHLLLPSSTLLALLYASVLTVQ